MPAAYAWAKRAVSRRAQEDAALLAEIRAAHAASHGTYGAPRIQVELAAKGLRAGRKRVARLMAAAGLVGVSRRKFVTTTVKGEGRRAPDLVDRNFTAEKPDVLWVADITYIPTWAGFLYLAVVLDACSRRIVGWSMATTLATRIVLDALDMALATRRPDGFVIAFGLRTEQFEQESFLHVFSPFADACKLTETRPFRKGPSLLAADPGERGVARTTRRRLDFTNVHRFQSPLTLLHVEMDFHPLLESRASAFSNRGIVNIDGPVPVALDEAVPFFVIEELDDTLRHVWHPPSGPIRKSPSVPVVHAPESRDSISLRIRRAAVHGSSLRATLRQMKSPRFVPT